jgi:hypothetical protein
MMRLVLDHRAEPLADRDRRICRRAAFLGETSIGELSEQGARLVVKAIVVGERRVEAVGEIAARCLTRSPKENLPGAGDHSRSAAGICTITRRVRSCTRSR